MGELLDQPSPFTDFITESKKKYVIIPAQLTVSLLHDEMSRGLKDGKRVFVVDGFPRSVDQANYFDEIVSSRSLAVDAVLTPSDFPSLFYDSAGLR